MRLTKEMIDAGRGNAGTFNGKQVRALGLEWKTLRKGWTFRLRGTEISPENYAAFLAAKSPPKPRQFDFFKESQWETALKECNAEYDADPERFLAGD